MRLNHKIYYLFGQSKNYYTLLGLKNNATNSEIKKRFHYLAKIYHPDVWQSKRGDEEKFRQILEAYKVLSEESLRNQYDKQIKNDQEKEEKKKQRCDFEQKNQKNKNQWSQTSQHSQERNIKNFQTKKLITVIFKAILGLTAFSLFFRIIEHRRFSRKLSYPEDPEFLKERELEDDLSTNQIIYVHPKECKKIPIKVLDSMVASSRYDLPPECLKIIKDYHKETGYNNQFNLDNHIKGYQQNLKKQQNEL